MAAWDPTSWLDANACRHNVQRYDDAFVVAANVSSTSSQSRLSAARAVSLPSTASTAVPASTCRCRFGTAAASGRNPVSCHTRSTSLDVITSQQGREQPHKPYLQHVLQKQRLHRIQEALRLDIPHVVVVLLKVPSEQVHLHAVETTHAEQPHSRPTRTSHSVCTASAAHTWIVALMTMTRRSGLTANRSRSTMSMKSVCLRVTRKNTTR